MSDKNDGGPVYPCKTYTRNGTPAGESMGMSLRDWFAGQALAGLLAHSSGQDPVKGFAEEAYKLADAMIKERDR